MGEREGEGGRWSPLLLDQLCGSPLPALPRTPSVSGIPSCYAGAPRCTPSATLRSYAARRTSFETSSPSSTHLATVRENSRSAHSASAFPAECAPTRSAAPHTTPENAGWSTPARCRSVSPTAVLARPQSHPTRASLSDWQSSYPLPRPSTLAYRHPPRSAPGSPFHTPPHRAGNPVPTPGSPKSAPAAAFPRARSVSASSAPASTRPPDTRDALACGSRALLRGPAKYAAADTRSAAWTAPTPPAAFVAAHRYACSGSDSSILPSSSGHTLAAG